jgi:hypothetical protein
MHRFHREKPVALGGPGKFAEHTRIRVEAQIPSGDARTGRQLTNLQHSR